MGWTINDRGVVGQRFRFLSSFYLATHCTVFYFISHSGDTFFSAVPQIFFPICTTPPQMINGHPVIMLHQLTVHHCSNPIQTLFINVKLNNTKTLFSEGEKCHSNWKKGLILSCVREVGSPARTTSQAHISCLLKSLGSCYFFPKCKPQLKGWSTANTQPVATATDYRHTHKDHGLVMVNVYGFVFHESSLLNSAKPSSYYRPSCVPVHTESKLLRP